MPVASGAWRVSGPAGVSGCGTYICGWREGCSLLSARCSSYSYRGDSEQRERVRGLSRTERVQSRRTGGWIGNYLVTRKGEGKGERTRREGEGERERRGEGTGEKEKERGRERERGGMRRRIPNANANDESEIKVWLV